MGEIVLEWPYKPCSLGTEPESPAKDMDVKAIIFDWEHTLFDSETEKEFPDAQKVLKYLHGRGYKLAVASLVSIHTNVTLEERIMQIQRSPLRIFFQIIEATNKDKDIIFDKIVEVFQIPRERVLIVDDRTIRGIRYGNMHGHPTIWFCNGKFANETPNAETGQPTAVIHSLIELENLL